MVRTDERRAYIVSWRAVVIAADANPPLPATHPSRSKSNRPAMRADCFVTRVNTKAMKRDSMLLTDSAR